jgi:hypothetical protein
MAQIHPKVHFIGNLLLFICAIISSCKKPEPDIPLLEVEIDACANSVFDSTKILFQNNSILLYGGEADSQHFDITDWSLNACQLRFGLSREYFPAVRSPKYATVNEESNNYAPDARFILVEGNPAKAYSIDLLVKHEVVNDTINGDPILVGYCVLADLAAVYSRVYCDSVFTFGLSGYTYHDPAFYGNIESFVMWDRETESLWWPLADKAVSGRMKDMSLEKYPEIKWREVIWSEIKTEYPNARVLARNIEVLAPVDWSIYYDQLSCP